MRIGYVLLEGRRKPDKTYRTKYESGLTARQYLAKLESDQADRNQHPLGQC